MNPILDFNDNGGAVIEIPQIGNSYSLVVNHWEKTEIQLQEIEKDLQQSDSEQRTIFLKKYAEELRKFQERFQQFDLNDNEEEDDDEKVMDCADKELHIYNFELKHSLAWYLMSCVDAEIIKVENEIDNQRGILIAKNDFDTTWKIIRESQSPHQATTELIKHLSLSKSQAIAVVGLRMRDMTSGTDAQINNINFLQTQKTFLENLK